MHKISRRAALGIVGMAAGSAALGISKPVWQLGTAPRILVLGGGPGGVAAALETKKALPSADVTLIEKDPSRFARAMVQELFPEANNSTKIHALKQNGVHVAIDDITEIDWQRNDVRGLSGRKLSFDKIVLSPGVSAKEEGIEGYGRQAAYEWPHAWFGSTENRRLAARLHAMENGGTFVIRVPGGPIRYAIGPYKRAVAVAQYFTRKKPRSKILILDAKDDLRAERAFLEEQAHTFLPGMVELVSGTNGGTIDRIDTKNGLLYSGSQCLKANVVNFIPSQQAGHIALNTGLTNADGWCPVDPVSYQSKMMKQAFVIGDASTSSGKKSADEAIKQAQMLGHQLTQS